ncbi:hypothetical protein [Catellatospora sp. NPDC049609]|uniref:hypothetical protein n=1 Tax=Catellatospora sp. NPDC049609 TaxID=3155505 RepID=UPI00341817E5
MSEDRTTVRELRARYAEQFADQIRETVDQAPPFTASQLAFMRRCVRSRRAEAVTR